MPEITDASGAAYQSLYRRFRPQRFDEVLGQDHVALALRNAVRDDRIGHAYLFSGPRGTGKTSTARILGKALNCTDLQGGEPCGVCDSCRSVAAGTSFDVHELDAASSNSVDAMRDLVARTALATPGRWKVYIVDEVHMLSAAASNALLKTLEEPPDHVVFVLATTDPQKVLPTIRSRTQHFEFHLIPDEVLVDLLGTVAQEAAIALPEGALAQAVRKGRGSARDALSVLDQVAATGVLDEDDGGWLVAVITAIAEYSPANALLALEESLRAGRDVQQLALELVDVLRAGFLAAVTNEDLTAVPGAGNERQLAKSLGPNRLVRAMETIGQSLVAMRDAPDPRVTLEVAFMRLARPEDQSGTEALIERIERLERRLESGAIASAPAPSSPRAPSTPARAPSDDGAPRPTPAPPTRAEARAASEAPVVPDAPVIPETAVATEAPAADEVPVVDNPPVTTSTGARPALGAYLQRSAERPSSTQAPAPAASATPAPTAAPTASIDIASAAAGEPPSRDELTAAWGDSIIVSLRPKVRAIYQVGRFVGVEDGLALFALPNEAHIIHAEPLRSEIDQALSGHFGRTVRVRLVLDSHASPTSSGDEDSAPARTGRSAKATAPEDTPVSDEDFYEALAPDEGDKKSVSAVEARDVGAAWAETRLLEAFPGAEEVQ